jgi:hypothetical protein
MAVNSRARPENNTVENSLMCFIGIYWVRIAAVRWSAGRRGPSRAALIGPPAFNGFADPATAAP